MSTTHVNGGKIMSLNHCYAQFFYNYYYFFIQKR